MISLDIHGLFLFGKKTDAFDAAQHLFKKIQVKQNCQIMRICSDHGREFENYKFEEFCLSYGIKQEWSYKTEEQGDSGDGLCDDPLKEPRSTLLGRSS
jgi:hypothetical protein